VRHGVSEDVRVQSGDVRLLAAQPEDLRDAAVGHATANAERECRLFDRAMLAPHPQVAIESGGSLGPERTGATPSPFPHDVCDVVGEVDVGAGKSCTFGAAHSGVEHDADNRRVAPLVERLAFADVEQSASLFVVKYLDLGFVEFRWAHLRHRRGGDFALVFEPAKQLL